MSLSDRIRSGVEAAPWVIEEVRKLEAENERLRSDNFALAAGQCAEATADEGGTPRCKRIAELEAKMRALCEREPVAILDKWGRPRPVFAIAPESGIPLIPRPSMEVSK